MTDLLMTPAAAVSPAVWLRLRRGDGAALAHAAAVHGCRFPAADDVFEEDARFLYLPVANLVRDGAEVRQQTVVFALGDDILITLEPAGGFAAFDRAPAMLARRPDLGSGRAAVMYVLLLALNANTDHVLGLASGALEGVNDRIRMIADGVDETGRDIDSSDIHEAMADLNDKEELISRIQESQLLLERAARYLRLEIGGETRDLRQYVETLISDIASVKEHAGFEHDKVRYLQNSVMTSLSVKQNEIVKVFTIITAVFLPPTLVATFYGMNFAVMPELAWKHGFSFTIVLTLLAALLPLIYIKKKGWLR
jgi:magnesium transporter